MNISKLLKTIVVLLGTVSAVMLTSILTGNDSRTNADNPFLSNDPERESSRLPIKTQTDTNVPSPVSEVLANSQASVTKVAGENLGAEKVLYQFADDGTKAENAKATNPKEANAAHIELAQLNNTTTYDNELLTSKVRLEAQNEKLINQIIKYRSQIRQYEKALEESKANNARLLKDPNATVAPSNEVEGAISEREYLALQKNVEKAELVKEDYLKTKQKLASANSTIERLENELEQRRGTGVNNGYLRNEVEQLRTQLKGFDEITAKAKSLEGDLNRASAEIAKLKSDSAQTIKKLGQDNEKVVKEVVNLKESLSQSRQKEDVLKKQLSEQLVSLGKKDNELAEINKKLAESRKEYDDTNKQFSRAIDQAKQCDLAKKDELTAKQGELASIDKLLNSTVQEVKECRAQIESKETELARIPLLQNEVIRLKNELLLQETEIARLTGNTVNANALGSKIINDLRIKQNANSLRNETIINSNTATQSVIPPSASIKSDVVIVEVTSAKVNLRSGPGDEHSPVMQVQKGTRLTVENREGDWFRVLTPTGSRAYVRRDVVSSTSEGPGNKSPGVSPAANSTELIPFDITTTSPTQRKSAKGEQEVSSTEEGIEEQAFERLKAALNLRNKNN